MLALLALALGSTLAPALAAPPERPHLTPWVVVRPAGSAPAASGPAPSALSVNAPGLLVEVRAAEIGRPRTAEQRPPPLRRNPRRGPPDRPSRGAAGGERPRERPRGRGRHGRLARPGPRRPPRRGAGGRPLRPLAARPLRRDPLAPLPPHEGRRDREVPRALPRASRSSSTSRRAAASSRPARRSSSPRKRPPSSTSSASTSTTSRRHPRRSARRRTAFRSRGPSSSPRPRLAGAGALLDLAARFSAVDAPVVAAPLADPAGVPLLDRLGALLAGDVNRDGRSATAQTPEGTALSVFRFAKGTDLGGVVLVTGRGRLRRPGAGPVRPRARLPVLHDRRGLRARHRPLPALRPPEGGDAPPLAHDRERAARRRPDGEGEGAVRGDARRDRRLRRPRPDRRGDPGEAPGLASRTRRPLDPLHRDEPHVVPLPPRGLPHLLRADLRGAVLLRARQGLRLGLADLVRQRREVEGEEGPRAAAPAAREGLRAPPQPDVQRGLPLRAGRRGRSRAASPAGSSRFEPSEGFKAQGDLRRQGLHRQVRLLAPPGRRAGS